MHFRCIDHDRQKDCPKFVSKTQLLTNQTLNHGYLHVKKVNSVHALWDAMCISIYKWDSFR